MRRKSVAHTRKKVHDRKNGKEQSRRGEREKRLFDKLFPLVDAAQPDSERCRKPEDEKRLQREDDDPVFAEKLVAVEEESNLLPQCNPNREQNGICSYHVSRFRSFQEFDPYQRLSAPHTAPLPSTST